MVWYIDTSAFLKLVVAEEESEAMRRWFADHGPRWSAQLLRTEALRAGARLGVDLDVVEDVLDTISLVLPSAGTFARAGRVAPVELRSLDAIHLAVALELGDDLEGLVCYDQRLIDAASRTSVNVVSPS